MLTDEEIKEIRNRATLNDNRQIEPMPFARDIERAVMKRMGEQAGGSSKGRTLQDYAIEHAEYMAAGAEQLLNHLDKCTDIDSGVIEPGEHFSEHTRGLLLDIYNFRKRRDRAAAHPLPAQAVPEWLIEMSNQMRAQDNRGTSHPFFQVRCKRYIVTEQGYNEHGYELCTDEGVIYRSYAAEEDDLEKLLIEGYPEFCEQWRIDQGDETIQDAISSFDPTEDDLPEGVRLVYVQETEEIVSTHLTEAGAKQFIGRKQHDYPRLYTYAESAYWSPQLRELQDWIVSLSAAPKP